MTLDQHQPPLVRCHTQYGGGQSPEVRAPKVLQGPVWHACAASSHSTYPHVTDDLSVRTGSIPPRPTDTPAQAHESNGLLTSLVKALSAAAAATAAAAAATDKFEITTTAAVAAAIADALSDSGYQATRPP